MGYQGCPENPTFLIEVWPSSVWGRSNRATGEEAACLCLASQSSQVHLALAVPQPSPLPGDQRGQRPRHSCVTSSPCHVLSQYALQLAWHARVNFAQKIGLTSHCIDSKPFRLYLLQSNTLGLLISKGLRNSFLSLTSAWGDCQHHFYWGRLEIMKLAIIIQ